MSHNIETERYTLAQVLQLLDDTNQDFDPKLLVASDVQSQDIQLTYAETILLIEGAHTGIADCSLPPYVLFEYEDFSAESRDKSIRSELLEWCLDPSVSQTLLKNGFLEIRGATILSSLDYNAEKFYITSLSNERDEDYSIDLSSRNISVDFKLNNCTVLKGISLRDSYTENISFNRIKIGITYQDVDAGLEPISLNAVNTYVKGDLQVTTVSGDFPGQLQVPAIKGKILLTYAVIENALVLSTLPNDGFFKEKEISSELMKDLGENLTGHFSDITACYMRANGINMTGALIFGQVDFSSATVQQTFNIDRLYISGVFNIDRITCSFVSSCNSYFGDGFFNCESDLATGMDFSGSIFEGTFEIFLTVFGSFLAEKTSFNGYPLSINASGIVGNSFLLRKKSLVKYGLAIFRSEIRAETEFTDSHFGKSHDDNYKGLSVSFSNCIARNVNFGDGSKFLGTVELFNSEFNDLTLNRSLFIDLLETENFVVKEQRSYAIEASNCSVSKRISFNAANTSKISKEIDHLKVLFEHYAVIAGGCENILFKLTESIKAQMEKDDPGELTRLAKEDLGRFVSLLDGRVTFESVDIFNIHIPALLKESSIFTLMHREVMHYVVSSHLCKVFFSYVSRIFSQELSPFCDQVRAIDALLELGDFLVKKKGDEPSLALSELNRYTLSLGEVMFEEIRSGGRVDCAGALFYRKTEGNINNPILLKPAFFRKYILGNFLYELGKTKTTAPQIPNSLTISHAEIDGTLFVNNGDSFHKLPFLANGEIDLQYSKVKQLSVTPSMANAMDMRWNLIGFTYDTIICSHYDKKQEQKENADQYYHWIYPFYGKLNFRQPFEQLSKAMFNSGSEILARRIIVNRTPNRGKFEVVLMMVVRIFFWIAFPMEHAVYSFLGLWLFGSWIFWGAEQGQLICPDKVEINFNNFAFAAQKLLPLLSGEQESNFRAVYTPGHPLFLFFYNIYPMLGTFIFGMLIIGLARIKRNSE